MAGFRIDRINEEIKRELSTIVPSIKDPRVPDMISIVAVKTTPDLHFCKVYVSFLGDVDEKAAIKGLESAAGYIRHEIGQKIKLRYIPQFQFVCDHSIQYGAKISKMIDDINKGDK
jgi:ribosome-binding factor A